MINAFIRTCVLVCAFAQTPGTDLRPLLEGHKPVLRQLVGALDSELTYMLQVRLLCARHRH